jgi:hypothetical protein
MICGSPTKCYGLDNSETDSRLLTIQRQKGWRLFNNLLVVEELENKHAKKNRWRPFCLGFGLHPNEEGLDSRVSDATLDYIGKEAEKRYRAKNASVLTEQPHNLAKTPNL